MIKTRKKTRGGDNSISSTFSKAGNTVNAIGNTVSNIASAIPGVGKDVISPAIKGITDVANTVANGISSAFSWLGLGDHISRIETHLGLEPITKDERHYYSQHQRLHNDYANELHELGKEIHRKMTAGTYEIGGNKGGTYEIGGNKKGGTYKIGRTYKIGGNAYQQKDTGNDWV